MRCQRRGQALKARWDSTALPDLNSINSTKATIQEKWHVLVSVDHQVLGSHIKIPRISGGS